MKKFRRILWGVILIAAGVLYALKTLDVVQFNIFFKGWWTLFIILPCTVDLLTERDKTGSLIGLAIGVAMLLWQRGFLELDLAWKLVVPVIIVAIGLKLVFGGLFTKKSAPLFEKFKKRDASAKTATAIFSGSDLRLDGEVFEGAELTAVFGGVDCDLRNAIIEKDACIRATAVFGGVEILVPSNVNVVVSSTGIFGSVSNEAAARGNTVTLYVSATSLFGGIDIQ